MTLLADAVGDNVAWCALVSGGPGTEPHPGCWLAPPVPPPLFPDLVTLRPGVSAAAVAEALRDRPACSVKDSYADVDLTSAGFRVLFEATWVGRPATATAAPVDHGTTVTTPAALAAWCAAAGLPSALPTRLLGAPQVTVVARYDSGRPVAGAVLHRRGSTVGLSTVGLSTVGLSTVFGDDPWPDLLRAVADADAVGYEHGDALTAAVRAGMTPLGPLRVWVR